MGNTYFVIMFVDRESLTQEARTPTLASIFSMGGYTPISFTYSQTPYFLEIFYNTPLLLRSTFFL